MNDTDFIEGNYVYHFDVLNTNTVFANSRMWRIYFFINQQLQIS